MQDSIEPSKIEIGSYVKYQGHPYIVVGMTHNLVSLMNNTSNCKVAVEVSEVVDLGFKAKVLQYMDEDFLVTAHGLIISLYSKRICQWPLNSEARIELYQKFYN